MSSSLGQVQSYLLKLEKEGDELRFLRAKNFLKSLAVGLLAYFGLGGVLAAMIAMLALYFILDAILETWRGQLVLEFESTLNRFDGDRTEAMFEVERHRKRKRHAKRIA